MGNSRFIDVVAKGSIPTSKDGGNKKPNAAKGKGKQQMMQVMQMFMGGKFTGFPAANKSMVKSQGFKKKPGDANEEQDPAGSGRVFVRGFDFGTTDEQFEKHMSKAGAIHEVHW